MVINIKIAILVIHVMQLGYITVRHCLFDAGISQATRYNIPDVLARPILKFLLLVAPDIGIGPSVFVILRYAFTASGVGRFTDLAHPVKNTMDVTSRSTVAGVIILFILPSN
jgi:hypothetical protein